MAEAATSFRRFRVTDENAVLAEIAESEAALALAISSGDEAAQLMPRLHLGFYLTPLDREGEAIAHLGVAHALAQKLDEKAREIEVLLTLALQFSMPETGSRPWPSSLKDSIALTPMRSMNRSIFCFIIVVLARWNWGGLAMRDDPLPPLWQSGRRSVRRPLSSRHARR